MPPGGHIDENETPEETAKRECKEETGLDVEIVGDDDWLSNNTTIQQSDNQTIKLIPDLFAHCPEEGRMLKKPIAMLLENIPDCPERNEPAHEHMDFLFLARPIDEAQEAVLAEEEGSEMRWFSRREIEALDVETEIFGNVQKYILDILP